MKQIDRKDAKETNNIKSALENFTKSRTVVASKAVTVTFTEGDTIYSKTGNAAKVAVGTASGKVKVSQRVFKVVKDGN